MEEEDFVIVSIPLSSLHGLQLVVFHNFLPVDSKLLFPYR